MYPKQTKQTKKKNLPKKKPTTKKPQTNQIPAFLSLLMFFLHIKCFLKFYFIGEPAFGN